MSAVCYMTGCRKRGVFTVEPVEGYRVRICRPCFSARYGVSAPWLLPGKPVPLKQTQVTHIEASESVKTLRSSGHGQPIPWSYRRARA